MNVFDLEPMLEFLDIVVWDGPIRYFPLKNGHFKKWFPDTSLQLHAPEGTILEVQTPEGNEIIQVRHATFIEVEEGITIIKGNRLFWIGEFMNA